MKQAPGLHWSSCMVVYTCSPTEQQKKAHSMQTANLHSFNFIYCFINLWRILCFFGFKMYRAKIVSVYVSIFFFPFHWFINYTLCHVEFKKRALIPIQCSLSPPWDKSLWWHHPVFSMSNPQGQLMRCLIQTQIISANPVSSETVPLPHNTFSSFPSFFFLSYVFLSSCCLCLLRKKCCKMQIPFWSITTASAFRLFVFEPANLFSHCCFHIQLWVSVQPQLPCHSFICLSNSED